MAPPIAVPARNLGISYNLRVRKAPVLVARRDATGSLALLPSVMAKVRALVR